MKLIERPWEGLPQQIAAGIRERLRAIVDDAVETVHAHIPEYQQPDPAGASVDEALERVRVGAEYGLGRFADLIDRPDLRAVDQDELYRAIGRATHDRGFGMHVQNQVYRVLARVGWQWLERIGTELELPAAVILRTTEALYVYMDELSMLTAQGYNEATAAAAGERHERRSQLLDMLLLPSPLPARTIKEAAERAGWPLPATVAAVALGPEQRATELAGRIAPDVLAGSNTGTPCLLIPDPDAPGRPRQTVTALTGHTAAIGPAVAPNLAHLSLAWATRTLALKPTDLADPERPPLRADDHLADLLLSEDTPLLETLIERRLDPLEQLTPAAHERMCETLLAWLEHECSAPAAARVLHTHPGTVRYRLAQLRDLFGQTLDEPAARFELQLALRARRLTTVGP